MKTQIRCAVVVTAAALLTAALPAIGQTFNIPEPLQLEHHELFTELEVAARAEKKTGETARAAMNLLRGHFEKEEANALPQLGALAILEKMPNAKSSELTASQRKDLVNRTERFRAELPQMLDEHKAISAALDEMRQAAHAERNEQAAHLAEKIMLHAKTEETVLYPAALLLGDYIRATEQSGR